MGLMKSVVNPVMRLSLKSPLHRLVPGVMLITVTGRRSGRRYTTPVQYALGDGQVYVLTRANRSWWRNLEGGARVELRLRGRARRGYANTFPASADEASSALAAFRGSSLERAAERLGGRAVIVAIELDADGE